MTAPLVRIEGLGKSFPVRGGLLGRRRVLRAVDDVSFEIGRGQIVGLVGESGSGKTTLGRCLLRLTEPTSGSVQFDGQAVTGVSDRVLRELRRRMQIVFQDPYSSLDPRRSVLNQIVDAYEIHGLHDPASRQSQARAILEKVGIAAERGDQLPHEFSGGQRQRISIARAIALSPDFLVADEAVSALDVSIQAQIVNLLLDLRKDLGLTMLFISHDLSLVEFVSDRVVVMYLGRVVEIADAAALYDAPRHPYTKALFDAIPVPDPAARALPAPLGGEVPSPIAPPSGCGFRTRCPHAQDACAARVPPLRRVAQGHQVACLRDDIAGRTVPAAGKSSITGASLGRAASLQI